MAVSQCRFDVLDSAWQGDLNLNICEAHAFNTTDRFSLDVFVVNGWSGEVCFTSWKQSCGPKNGPSLFCIFHSVL